jgi:hypothetical protein
MLAGAALNAAPAAAQVAGGVKGGVAFSSLHFSVTDEETELLTTRPDFLIGGFVMAPAASSVSALVEVTFSRRGARLEVFDERVDFKLSYLDISGLLRGALWRGDAASVYALGGLTTGFNVEAARVHTDAGSVTETVDLAAQVEDVDFRILVGAGIEVRHVLFEARYTWGLKNILASANEGASTLDVRNRAFELLAGVRF